MQNQDDFPLQESAHQNQRMAEMADAAIENRGLSRLLDPNVRRDAPPQVHQILKMGAAMK